MTSNSDIRTRTDIVLNQDGIIIDTYDVETLRRDPDTAHVDGVGYSWEELGLEKQVVVDAIQEKRLHTNPDGIITEETRSER